MTKIEETVDVRAPIEDVFEAVTDPIRIPEWNASVIEVQDFSGYPVGIGSTWRQSISVAGRVLNLVCTVDRYDPPREGSFQVSGDQQGYVWTICQDMGGLTRLTQGVDFEPPGGMLGKMMGPVIASAMRQEIARTMQRQREALEK